MQFIFARWRCHQVCTKWLQKKSNKLPLLFYNSILNMVEQINGAKEQQTQKWRETSLCSIYQKLSQAIYNEGRGYSPWIQFWTINMNVFVLYPLVLNKPVNPEPCYSFIQQLDKQDAKVSKSSEQVLPTKQNIQLRFKAVVLSYVTLLLCLYVSIQVSLSTYLLCVFVSIQVSVL